MTKDVLQVVCVLLLGMAAAFAISAAGNWHRTAHLKWLMEPQQQCNTEGQ